MNSSIARQKRSVQRQTRSSVPQGSSTSRAANWFTTPWPVDPIPSPPAQPALALPASAVSFHPAGVQAADLQANCDPLPLDQIAPMIRTAALREGVREDLVQAVIERESAFRPCAVSPKGAQGLMQLMPATARELGVADPFDPQQSLDGGVRLLKQLLDRYKGNYELALSAYNAGAGRVDREGGVPDIAETKDYVIQILSKLVF
jgi:soluble lytic murein transglycosylase-like protein